MSDKKFEECTLEEATHVEMGGYLYKIGGFEVIEFCNSVKSKRLGINIMLDGWDAKTIRQELFPILGIKPMKEKETKPIEFEGIVKQDMPFAYLSNVPDGIPLGTKFRCVQILEDEKKENE